MTFYSILFALAFLASVQDLFVALFTRPFVDLPFPAVVSILVFTDTIYTSHYMEARKPADYSLPMKLLDLLGLLLLLLALTVLSPESNSFVKLLNARDFGVPAHALFWFSLSLYFAVTIAWHVKAEMPLSRLSYGVVGLMVLALVLSFFKQVVVDTALAVVILGVLVVYLVKEDAGLK